MVSRGTLRPNSAASARPSVRLSVRPLEHVVPMIPRAAPPRRHDPRHSLTHARTHTPCRLPSTWVVAFMPKQLWQPTNQPTNRALLFVLSAAVASSSRGTHAWCMCVLTCTHDTCAARSRKPTARTHSTRARRTVCLPACLRASHCLLSCASVPRRVGTRQVNATDRPPAATCAARRCHCKAHGCSGNRGKPTRGYLTSMQAQYASATPRASRHRAGHLCGVSSLTMLRRLHFVEI